MFYTNSLQYIQDHSLYKNQTAKFPAILDSFCLVLTISGEFKYRWVAGARGGQNGGFKFK